VVIVRLEDPGGVELLARRLKARWPTASGLNAPVHGMDAAAASYPGLVMIVMVFSCRVDGSRVLHRTALFR